MRLPTFSRQSETGPTDAERPTVAGGSTTPVRERRDTTVREPTNATTTRWTGPSIDDRTPATTEPARPVGAEHPPAEGAHAAAVPVESAEVTEADRRAAADRRLHADPPADTDHGQPARQPKPRASLLASLALILGVAAALLVLSGPLLGYGIGVAVLALILSFAGIHATGRRHVAGKTDALIGMALALGAIVVGVLALTGSLSWLGTDVQPVTSLREWLDAQFVDRFQG